MRSTNECSFLSSSLLTSFITEFNFPKSASWAICKYSFMQVYKLHFIAINVTEIVFVFVLLMCSCYFFTHCTLYIIYTSVFHNILRLCELSASWIFIELSFFLSSIITQLVLFSFHFYKNFSLFIET